MIEQEVETPVRVPDVARPHAPHLAATTPVAKWNVSPPGAADETLVRLSGSETSPSGIQLSLLELLEKPAARPRLRPERLQAGRGGQAEPFDNAWGRRAKMGVEFPTPSLTDWLCGDRGYPVSRRQRG
jgi:hypothetical protein